MRLQSPSADRALGIKGKMGLDSVGEGFGQGKVNQEKMCM